MSSAFLYRPHVRTGDKVYTPDLCIRHAWASPGDGNIVPIPVDRLSNAVEIQQPGRPAHGVAAVVLVAAGDGPLLTVGSLHGTGMSASALLVCAKPVSRQAWRLKDTAPNLDRMILRGWYLAGGRRRLATEEPAHGVGGLASWDDLPPERLFFFAARRSRPPTEETDGFAVALQDPVRGETLSLTYTAENIG